MHSACFTHDNCRVRYGWDRERGRVYTIHETTLFPQERGMEARLANDNTGKGFAEPLQRNRDAEYNRLSKLFEGINKGLSEEKKTELDGVLWRLAGELGE